MKTFREFLIEITGKGKLASLELKASRDEISPYIKDVRQKKIASLKALQAHYLMQKMRGEKKNPYDEVPNLWKAAQMAKAKKRLRLTESALERKIEKGYSDKPIVHSGIDVIHHDPERKVTIYHAKTPEACKKLSTGLGACTSGSTGLGWSKTFMQKGNMMFVHHKSKRYIVNIRQKELTKEFSKHDKSEFDQIHSDAHGTVENFRNIKYKLWDKLKANIGPEAVDKLENTPHHRKF